MKTVMTLVGTTVLALPAYAASGSLEILAGHEQTTLDAKVFEPVTKNASVFLRERASVDYQGNVSSFTLVDGMYNLPACFTALGEIQATSPTGVLGRIGADCFGKFNDLSLYAAGTVKVAKQPNLEITVRGTYEPFLGHKWGLFSQVEIVGDIGLQGYEWSTERLRLGLKKEENRFGVGADLFQMKDVNAYNFGIFAARGF